MNLILQLLQSIIVPLVLTIVVELLISKIIQSKLECLWASIIAINLATNPAINIITIFLNPLRELFILELGLEILVIFIEAGILYIIYKQEFKKQLLLSFIINLVSYLIGLIIFRYFVVF